MEFVALVGQTALLGLAAAFTPSLLAMQVLVCSGDPWRRRATAVVVGSAAAFILVGGLLFLGFAQLPTQSGAPGDLSIALRLAAAVILGAFSVWMFRPHPDLEKRMRDDIEGYAARASSWVFLGVAFALSIKDVSSFVVLAPALHDIAVSPAGWLGQAVLLVVLYAFALSPVLAPPLARRVFGHRADRLFQAVYRFTMNHQFPLVGGMAAVIAIYLAVSGLVLLQR